MWMCRRDGGVSVNSVIPSMLKNSRLRVWACGWTVPASRFWWRLPVSHFSITFFCSKLMPTHTHTHRYTDTPTHRWLVSADEHPQFVLSCLSWPVFLPLTFLFLFLSNSPLCLFLILHHVFYPSAWFPSCTQDMMSPLRFFFSYPQV